MTARTQHTPGPWRVKSNGNVWVGVDSCDAANPEYGAADSTRGVERHAVATFHGTKATHNATLAAAAPDLLAACEDAEFLLRMLAINPREIGSMVDSIASSAADLRAAIARATR